MIATVVVFLFLLNGSYAAWLLTASQTYVHVGRAENVTLTCHNDDTKSTLNLNWKQSTRMQIQKLNADGTGPSWNRRIDTDRRTEIQNGWTRSGHNKGGPYMSITWGKTSNDTLGTYMCYVYGFTDQSKQVSFPTPTVTLAVDNVLTKLQNQLDELEKKWKDLKGDVAIMSRRVKESKRKLDNTQRKLEASERASDDCQRQSAELRRESYSRQKDLISDLKDFARRLTTQPTTVTPRISPTQFPWGQVTLLKADTGCPKPTDAGEKWMEGYIRFHTESQRYPNDDSVCGPSHMGGPAVLKRLERDNYFYMRTCQVGKERDASAPAWPKGNYCVLQSVDRNLPSGFREGWILFSMEDKRSSRSSSHNNVFSYYHSIRTIGVSFGCREDGNHRSPMELPVETPFYLFRHGGRCQEVLNAKVTEESFIVDTEDVANQDQAHGLHPDVEVDPVHLHTCYYKPIG